jgi:hypothetical protein
MRGAFSLPPGKRETCHERAAPPADAAFETRMQKSFARQGLMRTLGAELAVIAPGRCEILLPFSPGLSLSTDTSTPGRPARSPTVPAGTPLTRS